ncbi:MAG TPA: rhomboid family intramembrane serine protease [Acidobacteriota bacterium]|nr:rhomboid family intramembrane serine protease [Acidobacteriota bacterium]
MKLLNRIERRLGEDWGIPNLTIILIILQVIVYVLSFANKDILIGFYLIPELVLQGQIWRLISFLAVPPITNPIFAFFFWYMFYLMGTALENHWGTFRYNVYFFIGYIATVAVSFLIPGIPSSNGFLQASVFLAFAYLYPDFQILIFFLFPVKIKWLALLTWIGYLYTLIFVKEMLPKLLVVASIMNFLVFFASDIVQRIKTGKRQMEFQAKRQVERARQQQPFHRCIVCGITDQTNPEMDFRYCPQCKDTPGYCSEHLPNHEHRTEASTVK